MTKTGVFQPTVAVDTETGEIETDWFQSWTHTYDNDDPVGFVDYNDDHGAADWLDERLDAIRGLLAEDEAHLDRGRLIELIRPFFARQETS